MTLVLKENDTILFVHDQDGVLQPLPEDIMELEQNCCLAVVTEVGDGYIVVRDLSANKCGHCCEVRIPAKDFQKICTHNA